MLDLQHLKTFRAVVNRKNFTRAAADLGYSQATVTIHVKALERELGAVLVEHRRFSRNFVLTSAGRRVFEYAGRLLVLAAETKAAVRIEKAVPTSASEKYGTRSANFHLSESLEPEPQSVPR